MSDNRRPDYDKMADLILLPQVTLSHLRWQNLFSGPSRIQNCLQHQYSICVLGRVAIRRLSKWHILDSELIMTALQLHDLGEGAVGHDTLLHLKTDQKDLEEYNGFCASYKPLLKPDEFVFFHEAFLLQFCIRNPPCFPEHAKEVMIKLAQQKRMEALVFQAIEYWDYFLYAWEQYREQGNREVLGIVATRNSHVMDGLAKEVDGFEESIWTPEFQEALASFKNDKYLAVKVG